MAVSIKDIAAKVGVTDATVSMALRDNPEISLKRREQIKQVADEMGYRPHLLARSLRDGKTRLLSLIFPRNVPEIMDTAERVANKHDYILMVQFTPEPDPKAELMSLETVMERRVEGILWQPHIEKPQYVEILRKFRKMNIQVVLLESAHLGDVKADVFDFDLTDGFGKATTHLVEQGYERIVFMVDKLIHNHYPNYAESFLLAAESLTVPTEIRCLDNAAPGENADQEIMKLLDEYPEPVGVICCNDWMAVEIVKASRVCGFEIPQRIGLLSMMDMVIGGKHRVLELCCPTITSVYKPMKALTQQAGELLIKRIESKDKSNGRLRLQPMELIPRDSTDRKMLKNGRNAIL